MVIGAFIERSASFNLMKAGGESALAGFPTIDPDDIAEEIWTLVTKRDRIEAILPALSAPYKGESHLSIRNDQPRIWAAMTPPNRR